MIFVYQKKYKKFADPAAYDISVNLYGRNVLNGCLQQCKLVIKLKFLRKMKKN